MKYLFILLFLILSQSSNCLAIDETNNPGSDFFSEILAMVADGKVRFSGVMSPQSLPSINGFKCDLKTRDHFVSQCLDIEILGTDPTEPLVHYKQTNFQMADGKCTDKLYGPTSPDAICQAFPNPSKRFWSPAAEDSKVISYQNIYRCRPIIKDEIERIKSNKTPSAQVALLKLEKLARPKMFSKILKFEKTENGFTFDTCGVHYELNAVE